MKQQITFTTNELLKIGSIKQNIKEALDKFIETLELEPLDLIAIWFYIDKGSLKAVCAQTMQDSIICTHYGPTTMCTALSYWENLVGIDELIAIAQYRECFTNKPAIEESAEDSSECHKDNMLKLPDAESLVEWYNKNKKTYLSMSKDQQELFLRSLKELMESLETAAKDCERTIFNLRSQKDNLLREMGVIKMQWEDFIYTESTSENHTKALGLWEDYQNKAVQVSNLVEKINNWTSMKDGRFQRIKAIGSLYNTCSMLIHSA